MSSVAGRSLLEQWDYQGGAVEGVDESLQHLASLYAEDEDEYDI